MLSLCLLTFQYFMECFMERLKDHKETKADETPAEAGQVWPRPGQEHVTNSLPLLLLPRLWLAGCPAPGECQEGETTA